MHDRPLPADDAGRSAFDLKSYIDIQRRRVNATLKAALMTAHPASPLAAAMAYSVNAGGKRLRPILCMAAAEAVGGDAATTLPACCAIEMIHTYSLIHDDLPAMDNDALRRGKPTCHVAHGESIAILAGDGLLTMAFHLLSLPENWKQTNDAAAWMEIINVLSSAAGPDGMIEGQIRDIAAEGRDIHLDDLRRLHELKTGAMFRASVASGAILGGATAEERRHLDDYALSLGLAFQVVDDILDVEGDAAVMGKSPGADERMGKSTYPKLMGVEASRAFAGKLVADCLKALHYFDNRSDPLRAIAAYIVERAR
jgi:geranylgeranyl diphosphate synthase type II